jgi:hypothetical protein
VAFNYTHILINYPGIRPVKRVEIPDSTANDAFGFRAQANKYEQNSSHYSLSASERAGKVSRPLCIACQYTNVCDFLIKSKDASVGLEVNWVQLRDPEANWVKLDALARELAKSIFIDRPDGDFQ